MWGLDIRLLLWCWRWWWWLLGDLQLLPAVVYLHLDLLVLHRSNWKSGIGPYGLGLVSFLLKRMQTQYG
jgi:hypothetical protein